MSNLKYHLVAFVVVAIWGSTFVFTKMLLQAGLSPAQIFTFRFFIAYILLLAFSFLRNKVSSSPPEFLAELSGKAERGGGRGGLNKRSFRLFCEPIKDELLMVLLGITGGSLYFLTENAAMLFTTATNTSLIVCSCPLFAMLLFAIVYRHSERITKFQALGSIIACLGMAAVVLNGHFVLHLSPLGDMLAFAACLCWAVYSLLMKRATEHYSSLFITRKVFFYGLMTIIPYFILRSVEATSLSFSIFNFQLSIILNLLFLGVVASMLCYLTWNWVIGKLGPVLATNWFYFNPITTIIFAWWLLREQITVWFLLGSALILIGMYLADRKK